MEPKTPEWFAAWKAYYGAKHWEDPALWAETSARLAEAESRPVVKPVSPGLEERLAGIEARLVALESRPVEQVLPPFVGAQAQLFPR